MWEEDILTSPNSSKDSSFSFSNMISKFSPFSPTIRRENSQRKAFGSDIKSPKKNTVPGTIVQTTNNRPSQPLQPNGKKIKASDYFTSDIENYENNSPPPNTYKEGDTSISPISSKQENINNGVVGLTTSQKKDSRTLKLEEYLQAPYIEMDKFTKLTWNGITDDKIRPAIWRILIGYTPVNKERRESTLERKRKEYGEFLQQYWYIKETERSEYEVALHKQISIDVPRTNPTIKLFQQDAVQASLNKILYIWAIRHPASGYVQGINDLATPFFVVFISSFVEKWEECQYASLTESQIFEIEADTFWCLSKLLDNVQDNYTVAQPGIHRMVQKMSDLVKNIDNPLHEHLEKENALFIQFTFRWMNCLLMREIPLSMIVRMWDTYLSEGDRFANFHIYVCVAFLVHWSDQLRQLDFQQIMLFIQNIPTNNWDERQIEVLLSQAFIYQSLYHNFKKK